MSGTVAMLYSGPISWSSKKQRVVATSSYEAEYTALPTCAEQGPWIAQIIRDLDFSKYIGLNSQIFNMLGDNQGALAPVKNSHINDRSMSQGGFGRAGSKACHVVLLQELKLHTGDGINKMLHIF